MAKRLTEQLESMAYDVGQSGDTTKARKRCFVTIGATAAFNGLIKAVLDPAFLQALQHANYTELRIQYGDEGKKTFDDHLWLLEPERPEDKYGIAITGFDFDKQGLKREMLAARGEPSEDHVKGTVGSVVSHAGSGSILDALRLGVPILVVPNTELMDNHQVELAEALEKERYVVHGRLDNLPKSVSQVEILRQQMSQWPPVTSKDRKGGLSKVVKEEMGWLD